MNGHAPDGDKALGNVCADSVSSVWVVESVMVCCPHKDKHYHRARRGWT